MISIYALINPVNNHVFYVGASMSLKSRYSNHCTYYDGTYKADIIYELSEMNIKPELLILEEVTYEDAAFYEDFYSDLFRSFGFTIKTPPSNYKGKMLSTYQQKCLKASH